jgi:excisionase family DNA binding protein
MNYSIIHIMIKNIVKTKEGWISIAEALEILGISRMSLYKFIKEGKIVAQKQVNNQRLINSESVEKFKKERLERE